MAGSKDVLLVCEDTAHRSFVYSCLSALGIDDLQWHIDEYVASLKHQGGNRDDVLKRLHGTEFASWERRCASHKVLLVAVIDADNDTLAQARTALLPKSTSYGELFAAVIPKRNIQTWVQLAEQNATTASPNEKEDYKRTATRSDKVAHEAAKTLLKYFSGTVPAAIAENPVWKTFTAQMSVLQEAIRAWKS